MPFSCYSLRITVSLAALVFALGLLLQAPPLLFPSDAIFSSVIVSFVGLAAMALGMLALLLSALVTLLPGVRKRLRPCQH
mgnify:CR=1 FL=1